MPGRKSPFGFKVSTGVDDLYMFATSDVQRKEWVDAIVAAVNSNPGANVVKKIPGESRLDELKRRIEEQKQTVANKRMLRLAEREKVSAAAKKMELALCSEENAESLTLARLLAECKIAEDAVRLTELKNLEKALEAKKSFAKTAEENAAHAAELQKYKAEWAKLTAKAVQFAEDHANLEKEYNAAKSAADDAMDTADAADVNALKLRTHAIGLSHKEAQCKIEYETAAMLATALWTQDFKEEIEKKLNAMPAPAKPRPVIQGEKRTEFAAQRHSTSFMNILSNLNLPDELDLEKPKKVDKKLGSDKNFYERYIWINDDTGCFHWSKSAKPGATSKFIHIKTCIKTVLLCRPPKGSAWIGFSLQFFNTIDSEAFQNARGVGAKDEGIDVKVEGEDSTAYTEAICKRIIEIIKAPADGLALTPNKPSSAKL